MESKEEFMGPKDHTHFVKGKRTKRQRVQSPIPFTIATNSSSGDGGGYGSNGDNITNNNDHNTNTSPPTSAAFMDSTEEEEDMANCLILLAQGHSRETHKPIDHHEDHVDQTGTYKFNSKRYIETSSASHGKVGMYVYQCKTCGRTFPSFQALGGHRASHKKAAMNTDDKKAPLMALSDEEEAPHVQFITDLQLSNRGNFYNNISKLKVHECSICGAEFSSGQALGGHMRRHRGPASGNTTLSLSPAATSPIGTSFEPDQEVKRMRNGLSLDLNLPAPEAEHNRENPKFAFESKQQQQQQQQQQSPLVLSAAPTLVDCHY